MTNSQSLETRSTETALIVHPAEVARDAVNDALKRYFQSRRARVTDFVDRHFTLLGSLKLHRHAIGWDLARAPANLLAAAPMAALTLVASGARQTSFTRPLANRLSKISLFIETDIGRELEWLMMTELMELPFAQGDRASERDALSQAILDDPRVLGLVIDALEKEAKLTKRPEFRARLSELMATYTNSRVAAAEITTSLLSLAVGGATMRQLTPGALTLGPAVASAVAQKAAVASFPLGSTLGSAWYSIFPASVAPLLTVGVTGGLLVGASLLSAFTGILADPVQRGLGLHQRRLNRLIDALEEETLGARERPFVLRDIYVARLLDLLDLVRASHKLIRA
jgi:hypothetical protein